MLAAISPAGRNFSETLNTLQYAERAKKIVTKVHANVEVEVARRKSNPSPSPSPSPSRRYLTYSDREATRTN